MKLGPVELGANEKEGESHKSDIWRPAALKKQGEIFGEYFFSDFRSEFSI